MRHYNQKLEGYSYIGVSASVFSTADSVYLQEKRSEIKKLGFKCRTIKQKDYKILYAEDRYLVYKRAMEAKRWLEEVLTWEEEFALKEYNRKLAELKQKADQRRQTLDEARAAGFQI